MKKLIAFLFFPLFYVPFCNVYAQQKDCSEEKHVQKKYLHVNNQIIYSFCDSLVAHSKKCLTSPAWYKLKFSLSTDDINKMEIWCFMAQYLDSSYYCVNKGWLTESEFSISPYSIGVFFYKNLRFEVIASSFFPTEQYLTKSDSLVRVCLWDTSAKPVMMPFSTTEFPEYFNMFGIVNLSKNEITISEETCSCNRVGESKKSRKKSKQQGTTTYRYREFSL